MNNLFGVFFLVELGFEHRASACKAGAPPLETLPVHFTLVTMEMGSCELLAQDGL
jgi:hypothetical protein